MMNHSVYPCVWCNNNKSEILSFYETIFGEIETISSSALAIVVRIRGTKIMFLDGGDYYKPSAANSLFLFCESREEIKRVFEKLSDGGDIGMELGRYGWAECYGRLTDKFGIDWQLDADEVKSEQKILPALLFTNEKKVLVAEAIKSYASVFTDHRTLMVIPFEPTSTMPPGTVAFAQMYLGDEIFQLVSSEEDRDFDFTEGMSYVIECDTQDEIDHFWEQLSEGGIEGMCGWLKDEFGVSWQIVPRTLGSLISEAKNTKAVMQAMYSMRKFDIAALEKAGRAE